MEVIKLFSPPPVFSIGSTVATVIFELIEIADLTPSPNVILVADIAVAVPTKTPSAKISSL